MDAEDFLSEFDHWDKDFAEGLVPYVEIHDALTYNHWRIINYIRDTFLETGICPLVYETCIANNLEIEDMEKLFPDGYQRGAVKIAGPNIR